MAQFWSNHARVSMTKGRGGREALLIGPGPFELVGEEQAIAEELLMPAGKLRKEGLPANPNLDLAAVGSAVLRATLSSRTPTADPLTTSETLETSNSLTTQG